MNIIKEPNRVLIKNDEGKEVGHVLFPTIKDGVVEITMTFVDDSLRGQGAAGRMMQAAYEVIKSQNLKAKLNCSYAVSWFNKNPICNDIIVD